jgi:hypothetical protein
MKYEWLCLCVFWSGTSLAQLNSRPVPSAVDAVLLHPFSATNFMCLDHGLGEHKELGTDAGTDCIITGGFIEDGRPQDHFLRFFANEGLRNEDWYGWGKEVLAPCDCEVEEVVPFATVNTPGINGKVGPGSRLVFKRADGVRILYAHVTDFTTKPGQRVKAGQVVGKVGNNGFSWAPHTHVGAWREGQPLQVRFHQAAITKYRRGELATK